MADLLGIGSNGVGVAQQALSTVSNNIAQPELVAATARLLVRGSSQGMSVTGT